MEIGPIGERPTILHQDILSELISVIRPYFKGKPGKALVGPVDVRLPGSGAEDSPDESVVQPDLLVVCDPAKIEEKGMRGAPDLVIEIFSESTAGKDMGEKMLLYEKHGVRCYIVVDPWGHTLTVRYWEAAGKFGRPELFTKTDRMPIRIFEGLVLELPRVFGGI